MDHLLHSISIIHFKQASKRAVQTYVEVIPRTLIVYLSKVVPCFFGIGMYYLAFFGLDRAFLGMGLVMRMRMRKRCMYEEDWYLLVGWG
jgi:hypothetical protein